MSDLNALIDKIAELEERIETLETQRNYLADVIFGMLDGTRSHVAILGVMYRFSHTEEEALNEFYRWLITKPISRLLRLPGRQRR